MEASRILMCNWSDRASHLLPAYENMDALSNWQLFLRLKTNTGGMAFALEAVASNSANLQAVHSSHFENEEFLLSVADLVEIKTLASYWRDLSPHVRSLPNVVLKWAVKMCSGTFNIYMLNSLSAEVFDNMALVGAISEYHPIVLSKMTKGIDKDFAFEVAVKNTEAVVYLPPQYRDDRKFALRVIQSHAGTGA